MATLPRHIGYIVDGNRRWAEVRGKKAYAGHYAGYKTLKNVVLQTVDLGVEYVSVYVFSTENWKRSEQEVKGLMRLLLKVLKDDADTFIEHGIRIVVAGRRDRLSKAVLSAIDSIEERTKSLTNGTLMICLNYGGQQEIVDAVRSIIASGEVMADDIDEGTLAQHLYAPMVPECDLIVRTSGEQRLSNFMLWRSAYAELLFLDTLWPDMTKQQVVDILDEYTRRKRRFGG
jgi:undecaprenyl diphosphate synthase